MNFLMHSMAGMTGSAETLNFAKSAKHDPIKVNSINLTLDEVRRVADDITGTETYGTWVDTFIAFRATPNLLLIWTLILIAFKMIAHCHADSAKAVSNSDAGCHVRADNPGRQQAAQDADHDHQPRVYRVPDQPAHHVTYLLLFGTAQNMQVLDHGFVPLQFLA